MTFLEQSLRVIMSVSRSHISKLVQDKSPLQLQLAVSLCTVHSAVQYSDVYSVQYSTAGYRQWVQSKADQQRVAGDLIHAQTMQPGHHLPSHDLCCS